MVEWQIYTSELFHPNFQLSPFNLELYWLDIRIITLELNGNYHKSLEYCHQGREYFEQHPQKTHSIPGIFLIRELNCYLHLKNYPKGLKKSGQIRRYLPRNTQNRLVGYQYVMLFYLHRMKAGEALKAYQEIAEELHDNAALSRINWEKILLIRGYLGWLIRSTLNREARVATANEKALMETCEHDKIKYGFPGISQDKTGHNIAIQVLEFLELYEAGKNDLLLNHSGKWHVYAHRYLKERPVTERSYLFFYIIETLIRKGFTKEAFTQTRPSIQKIRNARFRFFDPEEFQEVIPFEDIWEHLKVRCLED